MKIQIFVIRKYRNCRDALEVLGHKHNTSLKFYLRSYGGHLEVGLGWEGCPIGRGTEGLLRAHIYSNSVSASPRKSYGGTCDLPLPCPLQNQAVSNLLESGS